MWLLIHAMTEFMLVKRATWVCFNKRYPSENDRKLQSRETLFTHNLRNCRIVVQFYRVSLQCAIQHFKTIWQVKWVTCKEISWDLSFKLFSDGYLILLQPLKPFHPSQFVTMGTMAAHVQCLWIIEMQCTVLVLTTISPLIDLITILLWNPSLIWEAKSCDI